MNSLYIIKENNLNIVLDIEKGKEPHLLHFSSLPFDINTVSDELRRYFMPIEFHLVGEEQDDNHGSKHTGGLVVNQLKHVDLKDYQNNLGRKIDWIMSYFDLEIVLNWQFFKGLNIIRSWVQVSNKGAKEYDFEYLSSFALTGLAKDDHPINSSWENSNPRVWLPHSTWYGEAQWKDFTLGELGLYQVNEFSMKRINLNHTGTWPCSEYLPMGVVDFPNTKHSLIWEIETNCSWQWELADWAKNLYLRLSGPTGQENHWYKILKPGETFLTETVAFGSVSGQINQALAELNAYRRRIRRENKDNQQLPVIFNDYMNCLWGDSTTEKLLPLIDAASKAGCEYFVIDAGWYSDGPWWDGIGEWLPAKMRYPKGIQEPLNYIREKGMIPGLWLEIELMGIHCPLADKVDESWFFHRRGKRVIDRGRYQLDFRNQEVINHVNKVIDRLMLEYKIGYIKMDYNNNTGPGTERDSDSFGDGLLQHTRAYLNWLDSIFAKYPDLIIENCSSGGMRMEYAMLSKLSIQSVTDQTDYLKMASIAAGCSSALTPEQAAIWSYPLAQGDQEEVVFNMINAMLLRIHQSGHLANLTDERLKLVKEGITVYKTYRHNIPNSIPVWPLGLPAFEHNWLSFGLVFKNDKKALIAVWKIRKTDSNRIEISLKDINQEVNAVKIIYPVNELKAKIDYKIYDNKLILEFSGFPLARLFELSW